MKVIDAHQIQTETYYEPGERGRSLLTGQEGVAFSWEKQEPCCHYHWWQYDQYVSRPQKYLTSVTGISLVRSKLQGDVWNCN